MAGPMAYLAPGQSRVTAWAITWAVEWRSTERPISEPAVMTLTLELSGKAADRSRSAPLTRPAMAASANLGPIAAAKSPTVAPFGSCRVEPSGNLTDIDCGLVEGSSVIASPVGI